MPEDALKGSVPISGLSGLQTSAPHLLVSPRLPTAGSFRSSLYLELCSPAPSISLSLEAPHPAPPHTTRSLISGPQLLSSSASTSCWKFLSRISPLRCDYIRCPFVLLNICSFGAGWLGPLEGPPDIVSSETPRWSPVWGEGSPVPPQLRGLPSALSPPLLCSNQ